MKYQHHDGLLTCPPYWNLEKYSKEGIDHIKKWDDFLVEYEKVWKRCIEKARIMVHYIVLWLVIGEKIIFITILLLKQREF